MCTYVQNGVMDREETLLAASSMYYLQDIKMETIASHLHMSRSSVSRLLKQARASGLVEISLRPTPSHAPGIGQRVKAQVGKSLHLQHGPAGLGVAEQIGVS